MDKKKIKKVSIIIRGKNESRWLKILLKELQKQTFKNFEIIFCDNNSEDNTIDILKKYRIKKIINIKKYLPGHALNKAIDICDGNYIAVLSSHCIPVSKNWIKEYLNFFEKNINLVAAYGKQVPLPGTNYQNLIDLDIIFKNQEIFYEKDPYLNNANSFYKSEYLRKFKFDPKLTNIEDRHWAVKLSKMGYKIAYTGKSTVYHLHGVHQHETRSKRAQKTYKIVEKKYIKLWKKCNFLYPEFHNFALIINARRIKDFKKLNKKIKTIKKNVFLKNFNFKKIFIVNNFLNKRTKKYTFLISKNTLKADLIGIYKKNKKLWTNVNYVTYFNTDANLNYKMISNLIKKTIYNNFESLSFAEHIKENFIIKFKDEGILKSTNLEESRNKASIYLLKWSRGIVFDPDYLRKGILFSNNSTNIEY
tara:strand:+ start:280 stop:1536 length:1257 start_codon:yes stop_codon:yes gene_type:complete